MTTDNPSQPLFYSDPEPLTAERHGAWRLREGDFAFAAQTPSVPIVAGEFVAAMRDYPIVFAQGALTPVAVLGLEQGNLFVAEGAWAADVYVPAYVRRYPFGFVRLDAPERHILAIDAASDRVLREGDDGEPLFDGDKPSPLTATMLEFCDLFHADAAQTADFCAALRDNDLLIDRRADATLPDGRQFTLEGFSIIDADRFTALDAETVAQWHARGWLALAHFHFASLTRFTDLLTRQAARAPLPVAA